MQKIMKELKKDISQKIANVFGPDLVKRVFISGVSYDDNTKEERKKLFTYEEQFLRDQGEHVNAIIVNAQNIVIEFTNNTLVSFGTSEWGSLVRMKNDDIRIL